MSIFNHATRIVNEHDGLLPVTKLSHEPSPFDTADVKTSMTYILGQEASRPGMKNVSFGKEQRNKGPWTYLGDEKKLANASPGPIYNVRKPLYKIHDKDIFLISVNKWMI